MYSKVEADPEAISLGVPEIVQTARDARDALVELHDSIDSWKFMPLAALEEVKASHEPLFTMFDESFQTMLQYHTCLSSMAAQVKSGLETAKRKERRTRAGVAKEFKAGGTPDVLADIFADMWHDNGMSFSKPFWSGPRSVPLLSSARDLDGVQLLLPSNIQGEPYQDFPPLADTHWQVQCENVLNNPNLTRLTVAGWKVLQRKAGKVATAIVQLPAPFELNSENILEGLCTQTCYNYYYYY